MLRLLYKMFAMKSTISLIELATPQKKFTWKDLQALPVLTGILDIKESQDLQGSLAHEDLWV